MGTAKHRIVVQSRQIQGGGSHALLCGMQEPPTMKMAALSQTMRACFLIEEGLIVPFLCRYFSYWREGNLLLHIQITPNLMKRGIA